MLKLIAGTALYIALVTGAALIMLNLFTAFLTLMDKEVTDALLNIAR